MFSILSKVLVTFAIVFITIFGTRSKVLSQEIPSIACPDIFQYLSYGNNYIGKVTLRGLPAATIKVEVQFSQREPITTGYSGRLSLIESLPATQANLETGLPISYRVDFPNPHVLPKLTSIKVNERTICTDYGLPAPSTIFTIHHIFYPSASTLSRPVQPNGQFNPYKDELFSMFGNDFSNLGIFGGQEISIPNLRNSFNTRPTPPPTNTFIQNTPRPAIVYPPTTRAPTPNLAATCGQEGSSLTPFIVGGNEFERGRFPWLAAIYLRQSADLKFICGGSLISARTVITAAHCFQSPHATADRTVVYLGRHNLYSSEIGVEQRDIQTLIKHPEFNTSMMSDADIALLQMRTPVSFTQFIRPICLWTSAYDLSSQVGFVAGWGNDNRNYEVTPTPKVVEVTIPSETECLRNSDLYRTRASSRSLCAGKRDGTGPCIGDSGSGLMIKNGGSWYLRAITSVGRTQNVNNKITCVLSEYVVYCDISKHMTWVHQNMLA